MRLATAITDTGHEGVVVHADGSATRLGMPLQALIEAGEAGLATARAAAARGAPTCPQGSYRLARPPAPAAQERLLRRPQLQRTHRRRRPRPEHHHHRDRGAGVLHQAPDRDPRPGRRGADLPACLDQGGLRGRACRRHRQARPRHPGRPRDEPHLRLHDPERRDRARRPAPPRQPVVQGQGPRRLGPHRPVDRDRRRDRRSPRARHPPLRERRDSARTATRGT